MISIVNRRDGWTGEYIGRPSVLGNPFIIGKNGNRNEIVEKYRQYLWYEIQQENRPICNELNRLKRLSINESINLICWCSPKKCHGDVVKNCIEWMIDQNIEL